MADNRDPRDPRVPLAFVRELAVIIDDCTRTLTEVKVELKHAKEEREQIKKNSPRLNPVMRHLLNW